MNEGQPRPEDSIYPEIPKSLKTTNERIGRLSFGDTSTEKEGVKDLYYAPHLIAEKIRELKKRYDKNNGPHTEFNIEIIEEYERLKKERENLKQRVAQNAKDRVFDIVRERMKNAADDFEFARTQRPQNKILMEQAKKKWLTAYDFDRLMKNDLIELTLEEEDEGLGLNLK